MSELDFGHSQRRTVVPTAVIAILDGSTNAIRDEEDKVAANLDTSTEDDGSNVKILQHTFWSMAMCSRPSAIVLNRRSSKVRRA
jgi:hypothetical protein